MSHTISSLLPIVRELFKDTLEADDVEDDDDFFWLGGDSFSAILVGDRLARLGFDVPRTFCIRSPQHPVGLRRPTQQRSQQHARSALE